jgi:TolB-like protein/DNA-binding SARP family transcriptional activator
MFTLRLLGGVSLAGPSGPLSGRAVQRRQLALLALLGGSRTGSLSRDKITALLWPESPSKRARSSLSDTLHVLTKTLGEDAVLQTGEGLLLNPEAVWCDVQAFSSSLKAGEWAEALSVYQGPFLDGFHLSGAEEFERWVDGERDWLEREARRAAGALAREKEAAGDPAEAVPWARRALALNPHDEMALRELMRLLAAAGDRSAAVEAYEAFARNLELDLELEPSAETLALARSLREGEVKRPGAAQGLGPMRPPEPSPPGPGQGRLPEPSPPGPGQNGPPRASLHSWASGAPGAAAAVAAGVVIVLASLGILLFSGRGDSPEPSSSHAPDAVRPINSLAVLPLRNLSPDPDMEYFADGLTDQLMWALSRVPGLRRAASTSSFAFKGRTVGLDSIARALRVRYVLEGSVRRRGESLRVTVALVDAQEGRELWSETYVRGIGDVFAVQDEIARSVVAALPMDPVLLEGGWGLPEWSTSTEAYDLFLQGREAQRRRTGSSLLQARGLFEAVLAMDSTYAPAWGALAEVYLLLGGYTRVSHATLIPLLRHAAARALELDSLNVEALAALGCGAGWHERDFPAGIETLERALSIDPEYVEALHWQGELLAHSGRLEEARERFELALEVDPLSGVVVADYGQALQLFGLHEEAIGLLGNLLEQQPGYLIGEYWLFYPTLLTGRYERAEELIRSVARGMGLEPNGMALAVRALAGRASREEALAALDAQPRSGPGVGMTALTALYAQLGDLDGAFEVLRTEPPTSQAFVYLATHPVFAPLRGDPRYGALVERIRLR